MTWLAWYGKEWGQLTVSGLSLLAAASSAIAATLNFFMARRNVDFQVGAERRKRNLDLFEKRFAIYDSNMKMIGYLLNRFANPENPDLRPWSKDEVQTFSEVQAQVFGARFLFHDAAIEHIDKCHASIIALAHANGNRTSLADIKHHVDALKKLSLPDSIKIFDPYLRVADGSNFASSVPAEHI